MSIRQLAAVVAQDADFMRVLELAKGRADFDVVAAVGELVESEGVPFLPVQRYKPSGLRKRADWEHVWDLQRKEDAIDAACGVGPDGKGTEVAMAEAKDRKQREIGDIPVPPKYASADFRSAVCWRLRGKLDVPKERFVLYPGAERDADGSPILGWAGWDHLQQAQALSACYLHRKQQEGWAPDRLAPLLAGLHDLLPWLHQWHSAVDPEYGQALDQFFETFIEEECRSLQIARDRLDAIRLPTGDAPH